MRISDHNRFVSRTTTLIRQTVKEMGGDIENLDPYLYRAAALTMAKGYEKQINFASKHIINMVAANE